VNQVSSVPYIYSIQSTDPYIIKYQ